MCLESYYFVQFSVTEHFKDAELSRSQSLPGVFFFYDLSPIKVIPTKEAKTLLRWHPQFKRACTYDIFLFSGA